MTTQDSNKLIAKFMGVHKYGASNMWQMPNKGLVHSTELRYHSSWDWLMPVVEKIAKIEMTYKNVDEKYNPYPTTFAMPDSNGNIMVRLNCGQLFIAPTLIEATWQAVVDFIQWKNVHNVEAQCAGG